MFYLLSTLLFCLERQTFKENVPSFPVFHHPAWQRISDPLYVYSAFCVAQPGTNELCPSITVLTLFKQPEQLQKLTCQLIMARIKQLQ